jgi:Thioredoxin like C-terminal domain
VQGRGVEAPADWDELGSPETYLGYGRATNFASPGGVDRDVSLQYTVPDGLGLNHWALAGDWTVERETAVANSGGGRIAYRFHARDLHLVLAPGSAPVRFRVLLDGEAPGAAHGSDTDEQGDGTVTGPRLYQLVRQPSAVADRTFEITFLDAGVRAYVFTFG